jgi:hypothetical protein
VQRARFLSLDHSSGSIGDPQSLNLYPYVRDDPTDLADPSGNIRELVRTEELMDCENGGTDCAGVGVFDSTYGVINLYFAFATINFSGYSAGDTGYDSGSIDYTQDLIGGVGIGGVGVGGGSAPKKYAVDLKVLNDCLSKMGIKTVISSLTPSTPGGYGSAKGTGEDWFSGHGNTVPITVTNDANTYNAAQISAIAGVPAVGYTDPFHPYTNYTNNNNNAYGTVDTQVWELGNSLWRIQAGSPFVPWPPVEPGKTLENCVRTHDGIQPQ